ncbi:MFS transporter [Motiliproteus coralliicola]|uniref:MFS transporter n=1 Tax=Motiliproteus coralliicola TaxID=2283196 RepID=A0A369WQT8_9GAMM|nr:MFS transporter [Motiliproteus coralliicola]RDE24458.1 MFS transporter [Motiliproteus coralliicola]
MSLPRADYWRLSTFYLFYFAMLGAIVPFWGLFLQSEGFDEVAIGTLMAVLMGTRIIAPNLWGWLADRTGQRLRIIRFGALMTLGVFSAAFWAEGFWQWFWLIFAFSFFWNAVLPQFEVITLHALGAQRHSYSRIRLWGSIGFILTVVGLGWVFDRVAIDALIPILWGLMLLVWLSALWVRPVEPSQQDNAGSHGFWQILRRSEVLSFFIVCLLIQLSHGPYYSFYSIYMSAQGYDKTQIGLLWALGVVAEVLLFVVMPQLLRWTGLALMMQLGMLTCALRWLLIALFPDQLWVLLLAQCLHAVTFGCLHATGIAMVQRFFPSRIQGQGQALYSSFGFGVGGAIGAFGSGLVWNQYGGEVMFVFAAGAALLGWFVAWRWIRFPAETSL